MIVVFLTRFLSISGTTVRLGLEQFQIRCTQASVPRACDFFVASAGSHKGGYTFIGADLNPYGCLLDSVIPFRPQVFDR
jgi:hypothetical protein